MCSTRRAISPRAATWNWSAWKNWTDADEIEEVWKLIQRHQTYTHSERAAKILGDWKNFVPKFVKVMPQDYKRVLQSLKKVQSQGLSGDEAIMAAFEENVKGGH